MLYLIYYNIYIYIYIYINIKYNIYAYRCDIDIKNKRIIIYFKGINYNDNMYKVDYIYNIANMLYLIYYNNIYIYIYIYINIKYNIYAYRCDIDIQNKRIIIYFKGINYNDNMYKVDILK